MTKPVEWGLPEEEAGMAQALKITHPITADELAERARREPNARVRTRLLAMRLILLGHTASDAAQTLGLGLTRTCAWVKRFNASGPGGLREQTRRPKPSKLKPEFLAAFKARVRAGATADDGVATLRGAQFQRILKDEFEAPLSLGGTYYLIHKLGFSNLVPRPKHPASDPVAQDAFKKTARSA
jgi:transposase